MRLAEAYVDVVANTGSLSSGFARARSLLSGALGGMGSLVSGVAGTIFAPLSAAFGALTSLPGLIGLGVGFGGILAAMSHVTGAASDLNEQLSKAGFVFGDSAEIVVKAADRMANEFGINKTTFVDAASSIGLIGKASGLTKAEAATMGAQFGVLAADISSFYNVPVEEALMAIRSGLVGEAEPLRRYGVLLSENAVKSEAYRLGIAAAGSALTEQQKVQARSSLIMAQTRDAQGDLDRTQDSFSNRSRQVGGQIENMSAKVGQFFLPAMTRLTEVFSLVIGDINTWIDANKAEFDAWAEWVADKVGYLEVAWKEFPLVLDLAREFIKERLTNILEIFDWLVANTGPAFNRMGEVMIDGLSKALTAAWDMVSGVVPRIAEAMANPFSTMQAGFDIGNILGGKMHLGDTEFKPLELTEGGAGVNEALARVNAAKAEIDAERAKSLEARQAAQAEAAANKGEAPGPAGPLGKASEKAAEIVSVSSIADSIARAALGGKDLVLEEARKHTETLNKIADNTAKGAVPQFG